MRFLHTADWHLGRSFFGVSLLDDQAHVLEQLVSVAVEARADAVLLAGDIYDRSTPPADAVQLLDETLTRLVLEHGIAVVVIAGNHDGAERLGFGSRLLSAHRLHVAATAPCVARFDDAHGPVDVFAIPFAEPAAVAARRSDANISDHDLALRADLAAFRDRADDSPAPDVVARTKKPRGGSPARRAQSSPGRRSIAVAHAFLTGGSTSESERPLVLGTAGLVGADCFDGFSYVALGHLHRPQRVGRDEVRYSGSLLKYSFDEASHRKSVSIIDLDAAGACTIEEVPLSARRDVRVLEGTLEMLQHEAVGDVARDDYVMARLTDHGAVLDSIGKLRALYPNCLRVDHSAYFATPGEKDPRLAQRGDRRHHGDRELFERFFVEVTGQAPSQEEHRVFADALVAAARASVES